MAKIKKMTIKMVTVNIDVCYMLFWWNYYNLDSVFTNRTNKPMLKTVVVVFSLYCKINGIV